MPLEVLKASLPYLAVLVYLLATAVLTVLARHWQQHIALHNRAREAKLIRQEYLKDLQAETNIEFDEEDQPIKAAA